jgi:hypothetical protein
MALEGWSAERLDAAAGLWKKERRELTARFSGTSMQPVIPPGTEVRVRCGADVREGDVAVCQEGTRVLVHRVIAVSRKNGWILTRGDATAVPDLPVRLSSVLGRITGLVTEHGDRDLPEAPDTPARRLARRACSFLLRAAPPAGRLLVRSLWFLRKWLLVAPSVAVRRLRKRFSPLD